MKTLTTALAALALVITALAFSQSAEAAARKAGRETCQLQQNDNCYYRGYPLWQWYSS
jgi:Spy/CpxP family protein refolding chaperone